MGCEKTVSSPENHDEKYIRQPRPRIPIFLNPPRRNSVLNAWTERENGKWSRRGFPGYVGPTVFLFSPFVSGAGLFTQAVEWKKVGDERKLVKVRRVVGE